MVAREVCPRRWSWVVALGLVACSESPPTPTRVADASSARASGQGGASATSAAAPASSSRAAASSAPSTLPASPKGALTAGAVTLDGFKLGDRYASTVMRRDPYKDPCDNDPIDQRKRRFMVYGALPCRDRTFPDGTTVAFYLTFSKEDRYEQPIEAFAWLGGRYFETHSNFPARTGQSAQAVDAILGAPEATFALDRKGSSLSVRRHAGDLWSIVESGTVVGFVVGPMPSEAENEQWRGLAQMYFRYTKPGK